jgi:peroxiredoxin
MREIAKKFQGQPLVVLSVSLDGHEQKWKDFIAKNGMTWPQCRRFHGPISKMFGVQASPHTFTIDADGVLRDEHIRRCVDRGQAEKVGRPSARVAGSREDGRVTGCSLAHLVFGE